MTTITAAGTGDWSNVATWNGGVVPAGANVADANGFNVTLDVDLTGGSSLTRIQATTGTYIVPAATTRTVTCDVTYNGTSTAGMISLGTGRNLTVTGASSNTSSGYCYVVNGAGNTLTLTGAVNNSGSGRAVSSTGGNSQIVIVNGDVGNTSTGIAMLLVSAAGSSITGNVSSSISSGNAIYTNGGTGTLTLTGNVSCTNGGNVLNLVAGTLNWTGASTLAASTDCSIQINGGTLNLTGLSLANSGNLAIRKLSGTLTQGTGVVTNQIAAAQAVAINGTLTVVGPTLPAATDVRIGSATYGNPASPVTPTMQGEGPFGGPF